MTKKVLVLGAHGQIAQLAEKEFIRVVLVRHKIKKS